MSIPSSIILLAFEDILSVDDGLAFFALFDISIKTLPFILNTNILHYFPIFFKELNIIFAKLSKKGKKNVSSLKRTYTTSLARRCSTITYKMFPHGNPLPDSINAIIFRYLQYHTLPSDSHYTTIKNDIK